MTSELEGLEPIEWTRAPIADHSQKSSIIVRQPHAVGLLEGRRLALGQNWAQPVAMLLRAEYAEPPIGCAQPAELVAQLNGVVRFRYRLVSIAKLRVECTWAAT